MPTGTPSKTISGWGGGSPQKSPLKFNLPTSAETLNYLA